MYRKLISVLGLSLFIHSGLVNGQVEMKGFPWSVTQPGLQLNIPEYNYPPTDNSEALSKQGPGPYLVATAVPVNIQFPESGSMYKLENGNVIWKVKLTIEEAKGIGTYLDRFHLPAGVSMYISNNNGRHIIGPFTEQDNAEDGRLPIDAVQGKAAYIELNINADVDLDEIDFHIYKLASYFRGISDLEYYSDEYTYGEIDWYDENAFNGSSKCMINANCPQGAGYDFAKNATVKEVIPAGGGYFGNCSGTLVNRLGNEPGANCKRYLLTATHCEGTNSTSDASTPFSEWITKFNYQSSACENPSVAPVSNNLNGVKFLARDPYSESAGVGDLNADFLLLELTKPAPSAISGSAVMVGFDRRESHPKAYLLPKRFIFFHHPSGDIKKTSYSKTISSAADFYWGTEYFEGYGAQGSSGSGMFDNDQKIMGCGFYCYFRTRCSP
ncbi:MAG: hypothetical protein KL787_08735 [Taibaiella sp.]|nr:hypothetical protein [Taibaiella sp.]